MSMDQNASHAASDGAVSQRGRRVPPQGVGGYDQNWYPLCLSSDVPAGSVKGYDFLNGRVIAFRGESGALAVTSAYCRHLGADLSGGDVIGDDIRCPYHHWSYAKSGACVKTATGDKPSASARLFKFPVEEKWGLVWVFNGEEPLYEVPHFSEHAEEELTYRPSREDVLPVDPFVIFSNTMDIQHLRSVHGMTVDFDPDKVIITPYRIEYRAPIVVPGFGPMNQHVTLWGTNGITLVADINGRMLLQMSFGCALPGGRTANFTVTGTPKSKGEAGEDEAIEQLIAMGQAFGRQLITEDTPIFERIRFSQDVLNASDRGLSIYLNHVRKYPRANPAGDLII
ncbi:Rieske 2Fe-2S domain-containing protein [Bradyrhizobium sp. AZCC 1693]|uniref:Rieske 2Fe-2S domain-containing protein n=1 Tax=Bradyrhizobium sp. AZCC 1693 TaxID=3117029 RepID=UPI002FF376A9